jgi:DNA-binding transcriptional LysR family regulator
MSESLRDIRLFVAAYEEGSFTAAALRENATQSGVSQHMHKLEARFGVELFQRGSGSTTPTPAGDVYYRHCIEILRAYEASKNEMKAFKAGLSGQIIVGLMPTMTRCALGPALASFMAENPNVQVRVIEGYSAMLTERVRASQCSFAVVPAFQGGAGLHMRGFQSTPEVLVSSRSSPLEHMKPVRLSDLEPLKIVLPSPENTRRRTIETYLSSNGARVARVLELDSMFGTLDLVANTDWVTILPGVMMASEIDRNLLTVNMIVEPEFSLDLVLIEPMQMPIEPVAEAFLTALEDETAALNARWPDFRPGIRAAAT